MITVTNTNTPTQVVQINADAYSEVMNAAAASALDAEASANTAVAAASDAQDIIDNFDAAATDLPNGTPATAVYDPLTGVVTFGIPEGDKGDKGDEGDNAYEVAVSEGFVGDETAWLASLKGADGAGFSNLPTQTIVGRQTAGVGDAENLTPSQARAVMELGTAATKTVGTAVGNLIAIDGDGGLPAIDGSKLTGLVIPADASEEFVEYAYDSATDGSVFSVDTSNFEDGYSYRVSVENIGTAFDRGLEISIISATGGAVAATVTTATAKQFSGQVLLNDARQNKGSHLAEIKIGTTLSGANSSAAPENMDIIGQRSADYKVQGVRFRVAGNNMDRGKIAVYRKKVAW